MHGPADDLEEIVEAAPGTRMGGRLPLYAPRVRVYPKRVAGSMRTLKWAALVLLLAVYYMVPWLRWDRGAGAPDQAILIDMPRRRAYFLGLEVWPQELYLLAGLLILAAIALFFATSLWGRVWCGYACPQTVWTDLYMLVERWIEGDRNARMRLDRAPLGLSKAARKTAKHGVWLAIAALTGGAWIMYFNDAPTVLRALVMGEASTKVYFFFGLCTTTTYALAGWAREQVCTFMCPWPRIQSAMLDADSLVVTYQRWRGEPRGKHKHGESWLGRGDCVDCGQCVAVCPTGIDIRNGLQLECIGCGLCVDACNAVMDRVGRPRGLIRFDTEANLGRRTRGETPRVRLARPRTVIYAALLVVVGASLVWAVLARTTLELTVLADRSPLYVTLSDGAIRNGYTVKVLNRNRTGRDVGLDLSGPDGAAVTVLGRENADARAVALSVGADAVATYRVYVRAARPSLKGHSTPITFVITDLSSGERVAVDTTFRGPGS